MNDGFLNVRDDFSRDGTPGARRALELMAA
jgi:hypothetical protein